MQKIAEPLIEHIISSAINPFQMPAPNNSNHSKLQEDALKLQKIYLRASSWIRDMSAPHSPARLRPNRGPRAAAGGGHSK